MLFRHKPVRLFLIPNSVRFRTGKLDIFVTSVVFIVFIWAFFIGSFYPMVDENNETIYIITDTGIHTLPVINMQVILAPLIFCYEILVLIGLDGKRKGRSLQWGLYFMAFKIIVTDKFKDGLKEYRKWKQNNTIKK